MLQKCNFKGISMKTKIYRQIRQSAKETGKLLWSFKWYIAPYVLFYVYLVINYLMPSPKNYYIWQKESWYDFEITSYLAVTKLLLIIFFLLFLVGTSNTRNHPLLAKIIFLSSLWFGAVFLQVI